MRVTKTSLAFITALNERQPAQRMRSEHRAERKATPTRNGGLYGIMDACCALPRYQLHTQGIPCFKECFACMRCERPSVWYRAHARPTAEHSGHSAPIWSIWYGVKGRCEGKVCREGVSETDPARTLPPLRMHPSPHASLSACIPLHMHLYPRGLTSDHHPCAGTRVGLALGSSSTYSAR